MTAKGGLAGAGPALAAAAGVAAAACLGRIIRVFGAGDILSAIFVASALAAALVDVGLVPGWVWGRGRFQVGAVVARVVIAGVALALAVVASVIGALVVSSIVGAVMSIFLTEPGSAGAWGMGLFFPSVFAAAGAVVGLGAAVAQAVDRRAGPDPFPHGRTRSHAVGGVAALFLVIGVLVAVSILQSRFPAVPEWTMLLALPLVLVLGGLSHNALVLRDAVRGGGRMPEGGVALRRAALCATVMVVGGAGLLVTAL